MFGTLSGKLKEESLLDTLLLTSFYTISLILEIVCL